MVSYLKNPKKNFESKGVRRLTHRNATQRKRTHGAARGRIQYCEVAFTSNLLPHGALRCLAWRSACKRGLEVSKRSIGSESVPKIITNDTINLFL